MAGKTVSTPGDLRSVLICNDSRLEFRVSAGLGPPEGGTPNLIRTLPGLSTRCRGISLFWASFLIVTLILLVMTVRRRERRLRLGLRFKGEPESVECPG